MRGTSRPAPDGIAIEATMGRTPLLPAAGKSAAGAQITTTFTIPTEAITVIAAPPELLSQRNVEAVTGIPARVYLEEIRAPGFPLTVIKLGKLRLVERASFVAWLREQPDRAPPSVPANDVEAERDGAADVLAELGYSRRQPR